MSTTKRSSFVDPMKLRQELADRTGAQPLQIEPATDESVDAVLDALNASAASHGRPMGWKAQEAVEANRLPLPASEPTKPAKAASGALAPMPWDDAHPKVKIHFGLRIPEKLHKQFEYAANNTLGDSMQTFALRALDEAVHKRLKELGVI